MKRRNFIKLPSLSLFGLAFLFPTKAETHEPEQTTDPIEEPTDQTKKFTDQIKKLTDPTKNLFREVIQALREHYKHTIDPHIFDTIKFSGMIDVNTSYSEIIGEPKWSRDGETCHTRCHIIHLFLCVTFGTHRHLIGIDARPFGPQLDPSPWVQTQFGSSDSSNNRIQNNGNPLVAILEHCKLTDNQISHINGIKE